jgi:hypothetical protein
MLDGWGLLRFRSIRCVDAWGAASLGHPHMNGEFA